MKYKIMHAQQFIKSETLNDDHDHGVGDDRQQNGKSLVHIAYKYALMLTIFNTMNDGG